MTSSRSGTPRAFPRIIVPGSGESSFDSAEADPSENKRARRKREVKSLPDSLRIEPAMIALTLEAIRSLAPEPKLGTAVNGAHDIPCARLRCLEHLRVQGLADCTDAEALTEDDEDDEDGGAEEHSTKEEKEPEMRGMNKAPLGRRFTVPPQPEPPPHPPRCTCMVGGARRGRTQAGGVSSGAW